ncbi:MAG: hypothetical protein ACJA1A_002607 [Saprospiraceae bacterium]
MNGTGTDKAGTAILYANLVKNGVVVKSEVLTTNGAYQFFCLFSGTYEVQLSTTRGTIGQAPPAQNLPNTYIWTGDHTGITTGNDGTPDGKQAVIISTGQDVIEVNFGIDGVPKTRGFTSPSQENPNGTVQVAVPPLSFSDPEEPEINNITIQSIPNPSTLGTIYYNGIAVTASQTILNYNPSLLTVEPVNGTVTV